MAGAVGAAAAVVFGLAPMLAARRENVAAHPGTAPAGQTGALPDLGGGGITLPGS